MAKAKVKAAQILSGPSTAEERRWKAESDLRTMQQYAELQANPSRIRAAEGLLREQMRVVQSIKKK